MAELQRLFLIEATKYDVIPLDDRASERLIPEWPEADADSRESRILFSGMGRLSELRSSTPRTRVGLSRRRSTCRGRRDRGHHGSGWAVRRLVGTSMTGTCATSTTPSASISTRLAPTHELLSGEHRVMFEFAYDGGAGSAKAETSPSVSTGPR